MRVIAGQLGGRLFSAPNGHRTHPMSDKMRGALFNILGDIAGMSVLDAFAGTGALSFEAISRGAVGAMAVENDRTAQRTISENITALGLGSKVTLAKAPVGSWLQTNPSSQFDLVLCDPPYDNLQQPTLQKLAKTVEKAGLFVLSWPGSLEPPVLEGLTQFDQRGYGDAQLIFYKPAG